MHGKRLKESYSSEDPDPLPDTEPTITFHRVDRKSPFPEWANRETVVSFLHENMKPYEDSPEDIQRGLDYAFSDESCKSGFLTLAHRKDRLAGALLMLRTGMKGYIPENLLLFISVHPDLRSRGIGKMLIEEAVGQCEGDVKLHVEYDNPAKHLYEKLGFRSPYAEMRLSR